MFNVYLVAQRGVYKEVRVTTHPSADMAEGFLDGYAPEWSGHVIASENDPDLPGPSLVALYNAVAAQKGVPPVTKFESRSVGKRRVWALLEAAFSTQPHEAAKAAPVVEDPAAGTEEQESDMASKAKKKKKPAGERAPRGKGKAAGKMADFRQVREGTDRQKVLKLMNGQNTAEQIASELGMPAKKVGTIVFCMSRDNGIGYEFGAKGQLKALFPGDKSYKDAIKPKAE